MDVVFRNTNEFDIFLCVDGEEFVIPSRFSKTVSRSRTDDMTVVSRVAKPSYVNKPKRSFWNFSFYHDYHLTVETAYRFCDVQDGGVFTVIAEDTRTFDPSCVIYERCAVYSASAKTVSEKYRVFGDREVLKKQYRKDHRKEDLFDFFMDPLIGFSADGCSAGCLTTILFWVAIVACIVNFGFAAVGKWGLVLYIVLAFLEWTVGKIVDYCFSAGKTSAQCFDECFEPHVIEKNLCGGNSDFRKPKKGFFGRRS
ncbi:MAG: hypothetical protein IJD59_03195 [Clostridia bacterium]|nr:hypothetical protein [Clostridia bacterium]